MGDPTKRGKKIVSAAYNGTAVGVCLGWTFQYSKDFFPQEDEGSVVNDAMLLMKKKRTATLQMVHGLPSDSDVGHTLSIVELLGDGTQRTHTCGNHIITGMGGSHSENGVTVFDCSFESVGAVTVPAAA